MSSKIEEDFETEYQYKKDKSEEDELIADFEDIFPSFKQSSNLKKGKDIKKKITITFKDSILGKKKEILLKRNLRCGVCRGTRCKVGTLPSKCWGCYGKGIKITKKGGQIYESECKKCEGKGLTIKKRCGNCKGEGIVLKEDYEKFRIPKLVKNKEIICFKNKGHQSNNSYSGNLIVEIEIEKNEQFKRENLDLFTNLEIPYFLGVLGGPVEIESFYGNLKKLNLKKGVRHGDLLELKGEGVECKKKNKIGSLFVKLKYKAPTDLCERSKDIYRYFDKK